ncbi:hypothetical protein HK096_006682, partial [Nowakowskiella sp. JEL0078]
MISFVQANLLLWALFSLLINGDPDAGKKSWAVQLFHDKNIPFTQAEAENFAKKHEFNFLGQIGILEGYYLLETKVYESEDRVLVRRKAEQVEVELLNEDNVKWFEIQTPMKRSTRALNQNIDWIYDPLFSEQWHLNNDGVNGLIPGNDINIVPVWNRGINGTGVTVSVIDDGVDFNHPDLQKNY